MVEKSNRRYIVFGMAGNNDASDALVVFHHLAVKVRTPAGDWQWLVDTPNGFAHSIYPTNAISADRIVEAKLAEPRLTYAVWETRAGGQMIGSI